jgi:DNA-binding MarR family transcriptional regulator
MATACLMSGSDHHKALAGQAWRLMFDLLMRTAPQRIESLHRRGLSPNDSRVLFAIEPDGMPIGTLAQRLACDASTATWAVGRLERAGLAVRTRGANDGRVKLVELTQAGVDAARALMEEYRSPPPEIVQISASDLETLVTILQPLLSRNGL